MKIKNFYDKETATFTHLVIDKSTKHCALIDCVMDYDLFSGKVSTTSADKIISYIKENNLHLDWILETHVHADHLTAASYIKERLGGKIGIGSRIKEVLRFWVPIFNTAKDTPIDGSQFDHLFEDGEKFSIGKLEVKVIHTPGHTPACVSYLIRDAVFVGDLIFMPNVGGGRADFPGADAATLYESVQKIFALPDDTKVFTGHDYPSENQEAQSMSTVFDQKKNNFLINENVSERQYIDVRNKRDFGKPVPKLLLPSIQVNLRVGKISDAEENGVQYIKIPVNKI